MSITVPTADVGVLMVRRDGRPWPVLFVLAGLLLAWPVVAAVSATESEPPPQAVSVVRPPTVATGDWLATAVQGVETRVAGLGGTVVAVDSDGMWPVRLLRDGEWRQLLGLPLGVSVAEGVGTAVDGGFVIAGVGEERTVLFRYDTEGRFQGATTIFGVEAGVISHVAGMTVAFDAVRPVAVVVGVGTIPLPGTVVDAAAGDGLTLLTVDGVVHHTSDLGETWTTLGTGYATLVGVDPVYAVGSSASVGLGRVTDDGRLDRLEGAPVGPTVTWGDRPAVYDWSTDSVWALSETRWDRIPIWGSHGFVGEFVAMIDGSTVPSVLGITERGLTVWQRSG